MCIYKYSKCLFLLIGLITLPMAEAQTEAQPASASLNYTKGSTNTSLFTGRMSYSIPIYTIEDPDFHLDIALKYSTEGFKPFLSSGCYGIDWKLEAGGCITRSVQGKPDDQKNCYNNPAAQDIGFIYALKDSNFLSKDNVFNFDNNVYDTSCGVRYRMDELGPCIWELDYMPDIFSFDFCGYKGRFIINNAGKARIISGDFVKIDVSNITTWYNGEYCSHYNSPDSSQISITTKDGYKYIFGGEENALEYSALFKTEYNNTYHSNTTLKQERPAISAWHIKQILAPNGRVMTFNYESGNDHISLENHLRAFLTDYDWSEQSIACTDNDSTHILYFLHKECLLNSIIISGTAPLHIIFSSHLESFPKYENSSYNYSIQNLELDSITVVCDNQVLKTAKLTYQYESHSAMWGARNCNWRYLKQVVISGAGRYTMEYNELTPSGTNINLPYSYPGLYVQTNTSYKNMVDRFGIWKIIPHQGLLSQISLPTGGKIKFTYGNHQYAEERRFRAVGTQDVELYPQSVDNQAIGGARIEKIETFSDDNTVIETQTFSYTKPNSSTSSGIFYNIYEIFNVNNSVEGKPITNPINYGMIDSHIGYSYVQCITTSGNHTYKTAYTFDTGCETYSSVNNAAINRRTNMSGYSATDELLSGSLTYDAHLTPTGKLLAVEQYNGNVIQRATYFRYNGIANTAVELPAFEGTHLGCIDTIVCLSTYSGHTARKLFVYPDVLEHTVTYEYGSNGNAMMSEKTYSYDTKLRKREVVTTDNNGMKRFTRYAYPDDFNFSAEYILSSDQPAVYLLQKKHRISTPIEQVSGYIENGNEYITSGTANLYANIAYVGYPESMAHFPQHLPIDTTINQPDPNSGLLIEGHYPCLYKTLSLSLTEPLLSTNYQWMNVNGNDIVYDSHYKLNCEYQFDVMDRLTSIKPFGATETTYTWNGLYPSSKTIGNQTTTYTYIPYVGVSSITDPLGTTTYYTYDAAGRLIETYRLVEGKKQILNVYQYHIKTE